MRRVRSVWPGRKAAGVWRMRDEVWAGFGCRTQAPQLLPNAAGRRRDSEADMARRAFAAAGKTLFAGGIDGRVCAE